MKRFESFEELIGSLDLDSFNKKYAEEELKLFLENKGSDIVKNKDEEPRSKFQLELPAFNFEIGVTSMQVEEDVFKTYYWIINNRQAELYKENEKIIDTLIKAIDTVNERAKSNNVTDAAYRELSTIVDDGDYSDDAIGCCVDEIISASRHAGYFDVQHDLIEEVKEILKDL